MSSGPSPGGAPPGSARLRADREAWLADLSQDLRAEGLEASLTETVLAGECLAILDHEDPLDLLHGLRAAFCSLERHLAAFDRCFWRVWEGRSRPDARASAAGSPMGREARRPGMPAGRGSGDTRDAGRGGPAAGETGDGDEAPGAFGAAWSPVDAVARRTFSSVAPHELARFDEWIERFVLRLASRRSRRLEPGGRRGPVDLRASARRAVRTDGEWIRLARRRRRLDPPRLVVLCDVSGSMERYSRFLVRFLLATGRASEIETFAFSTRLVHLTPWLLRTPVDTALAELRSRGWATGTRIGDSLESFVTRYGRSLLGRRTIVIILSDGLDQGEIEPLERAMRSLQRRARRVVWLNPLLESSRYAPEARGMKAALPFVDEFRSGHNLESLERLGRSLRL